MQRVCEGGTMMITCEKGTVINVLQASYGRHHDEAVCPHASIHTQRCHSASSLPQVKARCQGKHACSVESSNTQFGNPCDGTHKYLTVNYACKADSGAITLRTTSQQTTDYAAFLNNQNNKNNNDHIPAPHSDTTVVVICVTIVLVVAIVAVLIFTLLRSRVRKRAELDYGSEMDDTDMHSRSSNYIVEGEVEAVVSNENLLIDTEKEQQTVVAM